VLELADGKHLFKALLQTLGAEGGASRETRLGLDTHKKFKTKYDAAGAANAYPAIGRDRTPLFSGVQGPMVN